MRARSSTHVSLRPGRNASKTQSCEGRCSRSAVARRIQQLIAEERELAREIKTLTEKSPPAPRPARRRAAPRRPGRALLVPQRPNQNRGSVREARRRRPNPRLLRENDPLPPRPQRRPTTQQSPAPDPRDPTTNPPAHDRLPNAGSEKARPAAKPTAASSATSPVAHSDCSRTERPWTFDKHRSIAGAD